MCPLRRQKAIINARFPVKDLSLQRNLNPNDYALQVSKHQTISMYLGPRDSQR